GEQPGAAAGRRADRVTGRRERPGGHAPADRVGPGARRDADRGHARLAHLPVCGSNSPSGTGPTGPGDGIRHPATGAAPPQGVGCMIRHVYLVAAGAGFVVLLGGFLILWGGTAAPQGRAADSPVSSLIAANGLVEGARPEVALRPEIASTL